MAVMLRCVRNCLCIIIIIIIIINKTQELGRAYIQSGWNYNLLAL